MVKSFRTLQHVTSPTVVPGNLLTMARTVGVILGVALLVAAAYWFWPEDDSGPARGGPPGMGGGSRAMTVGASPATLETVTDRVEALGTTQANESVILTANLTDTVRRVNFDDGDFVKANTVLVELTNAEEEAQLAEARANLDDATRQLKRMEDLGERGIAAASDVDEARAAADAAKARLDTILARLQDRLIRAPFSGVLGFRQVSTGTLVTPGTPITTLDDVSVIKLDFTVPESLLDLVSIGTPIVARAAGRAGREFSGEVGAVGSRVDPVTRAATIRALLDNKDGALRPGMLLSVEVQARERKALVIAEKSVVQMAGQSFVFVVNEGQAERRPVSLGRRSFGTVEVLDGLTPDDLVIDEGIVKLRDGLPVTVEGALATPDDSNPGGFAAEPGGG